MRAAAVLGAGKMGSAFAEVLADRMDEVSVWNRTLAKSSALAEIGINVAATPQEAVGNADFVHLALKDDYAVDDVIAQAKPALAAGSIILDHSTTLPSLTAQRATRLESEGIAYLHCPVFMGPGDVRAGRGAMLVSGPSSVYERAENYLSLFTDRLKYLGERPDLAAVHKLVGNALIRGIAALLADIFTITQAAHVAPDEGLEIIAEHFDLNGMVARRGAQMASGKFPVTFELSMARKDVQLMIESVEQRPLAVLPAIAARMDELIAFGYGAEDATILARHAVQDGVELVA